jgi:hypothetical protein
VRTALTAVAAILVAAAPAHAAAPRLRRPDRIAPHQLALRSFGAASALTARVDTGPQVHGVALGMTRLSLRAPLAPLERAGVEVAALRVSGIAPGTYVGPRLALDAARARLTLGWMFDASDARDGHAQLGLALGF